jgi:hypothetical protein
MITIITTTITITGMICTMAKARGVSVPGMSQAPDPAGSRHLGKNALCRRQP